MCIVGSVFAIALVKQCFGGLGHNFMNPALAARAFLVASWPTHMTVSYTHLDVYKRQQLDSIEIMRPDYEESYTEEDKTHIAEMNEKLAVEYEDAKRKERMSVTEAGNPRKPQGEAGKMMIERMNESHAEMTAWALDKLNLKPTDKVLDVGCGGGAALKRLSGRIDGGRLYGCLLYTSRCV